MEMQQSDALFMATLSGSLPPISIPIPHSAFLPYAPRFLSLAQAKHFSMV